ncbi:carboxylesterase family protein [Streptacidiphilus sp. P02-A3a]|uniref:carboxylesterase family protein n=1 Tax=Streptacidiphilus sp. P02-A3a TaxID=2704468 RepID=UPI001CDB54CA|nr:carboxylesterase family protein [Streptacidiphilus sp. P02-A3a]
MRAASLRSADLGGNNFLKTEAQQAMAATVIGYWTAFARTGDPNHAGAPRWAAATVRGNGQLRFIPDRIREARTSPRPR